MDSLISRSLFWICLTIGLSSCQLGYVMKSGIGQFQLLNSRVPLEKALQDPSLDSRKKQKLILAQEARVFAEQELHLKHTKNYTSYVELGRPYVTYVVSAAEKWKLQGYQWSYPFMGKMPYKGFFSEPDAAELAQEMQSKGFDAYMRGVSAYSTLGWFNDPILSSMMDYDDYEIVDTIIHETVHATLYIKNAADFNERLASFLGQKGAEIFYLKKEGPKSKTLEQVRLKSVDQDLFSKFISTELEQLEAWYEKLPASDRKEEVREKRIQDIQSRFKENIIPRLKTDVFLRFPELKLNNARLLVYKTYMRDLSDFENLYQSLGANFEAFVKKCKELEKVKDPEAVLKTWVAKKESSTTPDNSTAKN